MGKTMQMDVDGLSGIASTISSAASSIGTAPLCSSVSAFAALSSAGFDTSCCSSYDSALQALSSKLAGLAASVSSYLGDSVGNDAKVEEEMPEEEEFDEDLEGVDDEEETPDKEETGKELEDNSMNTDKQEDGSNTAGKSGDYDDGTKEENKKDLGNINNGDETQKQEYDDQTKDEKKEELVDIKKDDTKEQTYDDQTKDEKKENLEDIKKDDTKEQAYDDQTDNINKKNLNKPKPSVGGGGSSSPSPEEIVQKYIQYLTASDLATILEEFNKGNSGEQITMNDILNNDAYIAKLRNIISNSSTLNKELRTNINSIGNDQLRTMFGNLLNSAKYQDSSVKLS